MTIRTGAHALPSMATPGVGSGQGRRQSPDSFVAGASLARDRVSAMAEEASVAHPAWAVDAYGHLPAVGDGGAAAEPRREWYARAVRRLLGLVRSGATEPQQLVAETFDWMRGAQSDAERLIIWEGRSST